MLPVKLISVEKVEKQCKVCTDTKPIEDFDNHPTNCDGKSGKCKECRKEFQRNYYVTKTKLSRKKKEKAL